MKQLFIASILLMLSQATFAGELEVHDAWVREAPPNMTMLAAYLQLHNHGGKMQSLVRASSPAFERVELHRSEQRDGMMHMAKVSKVMVAGHGMVAFEPGGLHLMLINPVKPLKAGDSVALSLYFQDGSKLDIQAPVRRDTGMGEHMMNHGEHMMDHSDHMLDHGDMDHSDHSMPNMEHHDHH